MKKLLAVFMLFFVPLSVFAANIKMVTYFPVPYASYQNVDVAKSLDVGVMSCAMNLSCPDNQYALSVYEDANSGSSVLKKGFLRVTSGRLDLNSSGKAVSNVMTVGSHSGSGGELDFGQDLRINTLVNRGQSLQAANDGNVLTALRMFPDHIANNFPACTGVDGAPEVSWQRLALGAKDNKAVTNVFMVCGKPKSGTGEKECNASTKPSTAARTCNECGTQSVTVTCNKNTGNWETTLGTCTVSSSSQCPKYVWQRDASYDCVFNPGGSSYYCGSVNGDVAFSPDSGPMQTGSGCNYLINSGRVGYGRGSVVSLGAAPQVGATCSGNQLGYYHAVYSGLSLGAAYTYGCVAYECVYK